MTRSILAVMLIGTGAGGCATREPASVDLAAAAREIMATDSAWAAAAASRNLDASAGVIADDGIMFPPDAPPVIGRTAAREFMRQGFAVPGFSVSWVTDTVIVAASGELAYSVGRSRYTFPDSAGGIDTTYAKSVGVWRRDADGRWRSVADIWNGAPMGERILPAR